MKRIISCVMICLITMINISLCGCKNSASGAPVLIWWMIGASQTGFSADMKVISDYTEEKIGVRVDIKLAGWGEAAQRFNTMINAGEYFDIMFVDGSNYNRFSKLGAFEDLTDLLLIYAPELKNYIPHVLWDGVKIGGRIFSVPTYKDSSKTGYYFWDKKFVDKYNIDLTRSDFAYIDEVFRSMKNGENNPRFYPFPLSRGSNNFIFDNYDSLSANLEPVGVRLDDKKLRVVNTLLQPDIIEKLRFIHSWYMDGIINPDANMIDETPVNQPFFMAQAWPSVAYLYAITNGAKHYEPVRFFGPSYSTDSIQGSMNAVSANSRFKKEALQLLQLINTDVKLRDMLHIGIEGKHFEYINDGTTARRLRTDWPLANYQQGSYFILTPLDNVPPGYWNEIQKQNEEAVPSVLLGFMMDIEPVMVEVINCRSIWDRYKIDLTLGASNPDFVMPKLLEELKAAGFDKVTAEAQRQIDNFIK